MIDLPGASREKPWSQLALEGDCVAASGVDRSRDRVTVDLRGIGSRLHACCAARGMTASALVRTAVLSLLNVKDDEPPAMSVPETTDARVVKLSLRLGGHHAGLLAQRAGAAAVSRGAYVAGLLDAMPPAPRSPNHGEAVAALTWSNQTLAALNFDLNAAIRLARSTGSLESEHSASLTSLSQEVQLHLQTVSRLVTELSFTPRVGNVRRAAFIDLRTPK